MPIFVVSFGTACISITSVLLEVARLHIAKQAPKKGAARVEAVTMPNAVKVSHQLVQKALWTKTSG